MRGGEGGLRVPLVLEVLTIVLATKILATFEYFWSFLVLFGDEENVLPALFIFCNQIHMIQQTDKINCISPIKSTVFLRSCCRMCWRLCWHSAGQQSQTCQPFGTSTHLRSTMHLVRLSQIITDYHTSYILYRDTFLFNFEIWLFVGFAQLIVTRPECWATLVQLLSWVGQPVSGNDPTAKTFYN